MNDFRNANSLVHAVNDAALGRYTPRPYNHFNPDSTTWWLVPSTEWPAFKYAKLFFNSKMSEVPEGLRGIHCGLSVEKGLSTTVKDFYPKELIKTMSWDWDTVTNRLAAEYPSFSSRQILSLSLSYIPPDGSVRSYESFLELKESFRATHAYIDVHPDGRLVVRGTPFLNFRCIEIAEHFREHILPSEDLKTLIDRLTKFPQSDWCWIDLYIGDVVTATEEVGDVWRNLLRPWTALFPQSAATGASR